MKAFVTFFILSCIIAVWPLKEGWALFSYLQKGDHIALITPAASADEKAIEVLSQLLYRNGLVPIYYKEMNENKTSPYGNHYNQLPYASSDGRRLQGFQAALNSKAKAIWILHGNQGCEKVVYALEKGDIVLPTNKKLIIGFSGVTNLHLYFLSKGWPCLHSPVGTISQETNEITQCPINTKTSLQKVIDVLIGKTQTLAYPMIPLNQAARQMRHAIKDTSVVGGALNILITHGGTPTALVGRNKIVFIEDEPQRPERVETMLMGLLRGGVFKGAKAIVLGSFSDPQFEHKRFKSVKPILLERIVKLLEENEVNIPIFHSDNFGHGDLNDPLPLGTKALLQPGKIPLLIVDQR